MTTNKIPENFVAGLFTKITATEWANKAHLTNEEGLKIEYYSISIDLDRFYETSYVLLSESMIKAGQNSLIMGMLNKLINYDPLNFTAAYSERGYIYSLDKQYAAAIKELEKSIAIEPSYAFSYCVLGSVLANLRKTDEALEKYASAIRTDPEYYLPYLYRSNLYRKNGNYDKALKDYNKVSEINPKNLEAYYNSGIIHYMTGQYEKAADSYTKALYLDELSSALYYNRGIAYRKMENNEKAAEDYKTYLLLTVKDLNEDNSASLLSAWMNENSFNPIIVE
jgi:tetratricopeptide (TPR) repeat protein